MTKKWVEVNDLSSGLYSANKNIRFKTSRLSLDLCDYKDVYIVVKGTITVEGDDDDKKKKIIKNYPLRITLHLNCAYKKSITYL